MKPESFDPTFINRPKTKPAEQVTERMKYCLYACDGIEDVSMIPAIFNAIRDGRHADATAFLRMAERGWK